MTHATCHQYVTCLMIEGVFMNLTQGPSKSIPVKVDIVYQEALKTCSPADQSFSFLCTLLRITRSIDDINYII